MSDLIKLTKQLYPTGRAFRIQKNGIKEKFHEGLAVSEQAAIDSANGILNSILPDNDNFTIEDAGLWEIRLGMISGEGNLLSDRKAAILRKMRHPGNVLARQHYLYIENQLQVAGFNVFVHENRFLSGGVYITKTLQDLGVPVTNVIQHGQAQHGQIVHGQYIVDKVANYMDSAKDRLFYVGSTQKLRATFFISGEVLPDYADVLATREIEFRELILKLKPANTMVYLLINYV